MDFLSTLTDADRYLADPVRFRKMLSRMVSSPRQRWEDGGMDDAIAKPVILAELRRVPAQWLPNA